MLKFNIALADTARPWRWDGNRWAAGSSWAEPLDHPALEHRLTESGATARLLVRERCPGRDGQDHNEHWPGDFITVESGHRAVRINAGVRGAAPVYLAAGRERLSGSWELADLRGHASPDRLVDREIARLLTMRFRYGHETLFAGVRRLTERSTAVFDDDGLRLAYPPPTMHSRARELSEHADVIGAYERLLGQAVTSRVYDPATSCVELSGGMDSANVATTLGNLHPGEVAASAMMLLGDTGVQQAARRAEFIAILGLGTDVPASFEGRLPLSPSGRRGRGKPVTPYEDPYDEAKTVLTRRLREHDTRTVFTGIGGDEMVSRTVAESPHQPLGTGLEPMPWIGRRTLQFLEDAETGIAPASVINEMTLTAQACAAPAFLRDGIWPIHPLADPEIVRFGEWLPLPWRRHKRLHHARLEGAGCPRSLLEPKLRENFTPVMREAIRQHGLPYLAGMLTEGSPLIDNGFADPDGLAGVVRRLVDGEEFRERETELYGLIVLDLALRTFA